MSTRPTHFAPQDKSAFVYRELTERVIIVVFVDELCWQGTNTHGRENGVLGMWSTSSLDRNVSMLCPALGSQR